MTTTIEIKRSHGDGTIETVSRAFDNDSYAALATTISTLLEQIDIDPAPCAGHMINWEFYRQGYEVDLERLASVFTFCCSHVAEHASRESIQNALSKALSAQKNAEPREGDSAPHRC